MIHYTGFEPDGIRIVAGFDNDPNVYTDSSSPIPLYSLNRLDEIVSALKVKVAVITVPEVAAQESYDRLLKAGVRGILNFSPVTLKPLKFPAMGHRE